MLTDDVVQDGGHTKSSEDMAKACSPGTQKVIPCEPSQGRRLVLRPIKFA